MSEAPEDTPREDEPAAAEGAETTGLTPEDAADTSAAPEAAAAGPADEPAEDATADEPAEDAPAEEAAEDAPAEAAAEDASEPATATPAAPRRSATRRRRSSREPGEPAPVVRAQAKYVRSSARKARLVCDHIRGKSVEEARAILALAPRAIAQDWSKLLESAVANAEHNHELVGEDLYVKAVHADEGPTIKRFRPRAMGRATQIRKRTSHLTILLTPKD
jgi:ribosomal protein L22